MGYKAYTGSKNFTCNAEGTGDNYIRLVNPDKTDKFVYFGILKTNNKGYYTGLLAGKDFNVTDTKKGLLLDCDTPNCDAYAGLNAMSNNTAAWIYYRIGKNETATVRDIIFKYNNKNVFTIKLNLSNDNNTYVYLRLWRGYEYQFTPSNSWRIAAKGDLLEYTFNDTLVLEELKIEIENWSIKSGVNEGNILYHVTNNKDITDIFTYNIKINELVKLGILTYVSGKKFDSNTLNVIKAPVNMCKDNWEYEEVKDNSIMYIYKAKFEDDDLLHATPMTYEDHNKINWGNVINSEDITSIGKYKYTPKNKVKKGTIYIIAFRGSTEYSYDVYIFNSDQGSSFTSSINYTPFTFHLLLNGRFVFYYSHENITITNTRISELLNKGVFVYKDGKNNLSELVGTNSVYNPTLYEDAKAPTIINVYNSTSKVPLTFTTRLYGYVKEQNGNTYHRTGLNDIAFSDITNDYHFGAYDLYIYL